MHEAQQTTVGNRIYIIYVIYTLNKPFRYLEYTKDVKSK